MPEYTTVSNVSEIPVGSAKRVEVNGRAIALFNVNGEIFATDDTCTHAEASLSEGEVSGDEIVCPLHFATFDLRTGRCTGPPADDDINTYPVRINGDEIQIQVP